jgi:hypothetical protein
MLWRNPRTEADVLNMTEPESVLLPDSPEHSSEGNPPELPPIVERERQPPRKGSNLTYRRLRRPDSVEVSVMAKPGRVIEEVIRHIPADGGDEVIHIITRRQRGRPTKQQTENGNSDHG